MVLDTTTFIIVLTTAIVLCGLFIFYKFRESRKLP